MRGKACFARGATADGEFTSAVTAPLIRATRGKPEQNEWRRFLSYNQLADVEKVAGEELRRLGYHR